MKRKICLVALVLAMSSCVGAAWAEGDFYVVAGGGAVGTKITSLPYTIVKPGFYFLGGDLTSSEQGITIKANNVTLDLMGFSLVGSNTWYGIGLQGPDNLGPDNVEIRNGTIRNYGVGVANIPIAANPKNQRLVNLRINHCVESGANFSGKNHLVKNCTFSDNGTYGLKISSGTISGCVACDNGLGIVLGGPGSVIDNTAYRNTTWNFFLGTDSVKTPILVNGNSADGLAVNYMIATGSEGVLMVTGANAGTP
jgi:hypothetical protein